MANYAHVENGSITGVYDLLPDNWRNISNFYLLQDETETLSSLGWMKIQKIEVSYNSDTQRLGDPRYDIIDGVVTETLTVIDLPQAPIIEYTDDEILARKTLSHNLAMDTLREMRDKLLTATDFTQLVDVIRINGDELTQQYEAYRQELRDLPSLYENDIDFDNAYAVVFPTSPGGA